MKRFLSLVVVVLCLSGCGTRLSKSEVKATPAAIEKAIESQREAPPPGLWKPGERKLYWLGGSPVLRREQPPRPLWMTQATERLVVGNEATRELSYQPALLTQELEAEVSRLRDLAERNRVAMEEMRRAVEKMTVAAQELLEQNRVLTERLSSATDNDEGER